jgi:hypothetical protein
MFIFSKIDTPTATSTPTAPTVELMDFNNATSNRAMATDYRIETRPGTYAIAGTWSPTGGNYRSSTVFKDVVTTGGRAPDPGPDAASSVSDAS